MARSPFIVLLFICALACSALAPGQSDPLKELSETPLVGSIAHEELRSRALGRRAQFTLYLPPGYQRERTRRYPVAFLFHDLFEDHQRWMRRGGAQMIELGLSSGALQPLIVCVPELNRGLCLDPAVGKKNPWRSFFVDELLPHVEKKWRTRPGRAGRALLGLGSGGYGALSLALSRPTLFASVAVHDPFLPAAAVEDLSRPHRSLMSQLFLAEAFDAAFGRPLVPELWNQRHPETLARTLTPESDLRIRLDAYPDGRRGCHPGARRLRDILVARKITHAYDEHAGQPGWLALREYLVPSLRFLVGTKKQQRHASPGGPKRPAREKTVAPGKSG